MNNSTASSEEPESMVAKAINHLPDCTFLVYLVVALLTVYSVYRARVNYKLPPGPWGLPGVGHLFHLKNSQFHLELFDLSKLYGRLMSINMGMETMVVLSDHKLIKKAFQSKFVNSRPRNVFSSLIEGYGKNSPSIFMTKKNHVYLGGNDLHAFLLEALRSYPNFL